ncbi:hypothetical protein GCM10010383_15170 [Streptomyces lomondensis]|uniref:Uncharacterized protein n=1 Tax=Streptomyces lomondensis TaxID=68229 RepID=A0ABQ2WZJ0_9ACTN|nr:hypothetical protein GCM10010383_15170 [Streptomyces lomondensis]
METVVRRHKTLGAWVPRWVAGPCHNPACAARAAEGTVSGHTAEGARPAAGTAPAATTPHEAAPGETVARNS